MDSMLLLARALAERHADTAADALDDLPPATVGALLAELPPDCAANLLVHLRTVQASDCLQFMPRERAAACILSLSPQPAAEVLRQLDATTRDLILTALPRARRIQIDLVLRQPRQTVGAWMDTGIATVRPGNTSGEALRRLAMHDLSYGWLFVVGPKRRLIGVVRPSTLMNAQPKNRIESLLQRGPPLLRSNVTIGPALGHAGWHEHDALPVVDGQDRLVGVITHARLRRALAEAARAQIRHAHRGTLMDVANIWYLGMAEIMNATIARSPAQNTPRRPEGAP